MRCCANRQDIMMNIRSQYAGYQPNITQSTIPNMSPETSSDEVSGDILMFWEARSPWVNTARVAFSVNSLSRTVLSFFSEDEHRIYEWKSSRLRKLGTASLSLNRLLRCAKEGNNHRVRRLQIVQEQGFDHLTNWGPLTVTADELTNPSQKYWIGDLTLSQQKDLERIAMDRYPSDDAEWWMSLDLPKLTFSWKQWEKSCWIAGLLIGFLSARVKFSRFQVSKLSRERQELIFIPEEFMVSGYFITFGLFRMRMLREKAGDERCDRERQGWDFSFLKLLRFLFRNSFQNFV